MSFSGKKTITVGAIGIVISTVAKVAENFESRWTLGALRRADLELYDRLVEQQSYYHQALVTGEAGEVEDQSAAMCRGWLAAVRAMEAAGADDDAYVLGYDSKSGTRVAIGDNRNSINRVRQVHGEHVAWLTPDEVAVMFAGLESLKTIVAVKNLFPGAEIINFFPGVPTE